MAGGAVGIALAFALASAFYTPLMPLADAYALRGLAQHRRSYGPVRLWGSAAFIVGSFGAGLLLDRIAAGNTIWLLVAAMFPVAVAAYALSSLDVGVPGHAARRQGRRPWAASCATRASWRSPRPRA